MKDDDVLKNKMRKILHEFGLTYKVESWRERTESLTKAVDSLLTAIREAAK